jgi:hypothetical protein
MSLSGTDYLAEGNSCLLCAISKKMNTAKPCDMYCINPMRSLLKNLEPGYRLMVDKTLWESDQCRFRLTLAKKNNTPDITKILISNENTIQNN